MLWSKVSVSLGLCVSVAAVAGCGKPTAPAEQRVADQPVAQQPAAKPPAAQQSAPAQPSAVQHTAASETAPVQPDPTPTPRPTPTPTATPKAAQPGVPGSGGMPDPSLAPSARTLTPLAAQSVELAKSGNPADTARLLGQLQDAAWLDTLDPPAQAISIDPRLLQLVPVLRALGAASPQSLDPLASSPLYTKSDYRLAALIAASGSAVKPGAALIALWKTQLEPEADEVEGTIDALIESGSSASLGLLNDAFASDAFEDDVVVAWFHGDVLTHRHDEPLLASLETLLRAKTLSPDRSSALVESLFEYRPTAWYMPGAQPPVPPSRSTLLAPGRARLLAIADWAAAEGVIDAARRASITIELAPKAP